MQRYYVPEKNWQEQEVVLTDEDFHHIKRVMRHKVGDKLICNHPNGQAAICVITSIEDTYIKVHIEEWLEQNNELPINVTILQGLPKSNKLELILQKGTELGAAAFQIFEADRSVAKWDMKKANNRYKRYNKIIKEASEQCHRNMLPQIKAVDSLHNIVDQNTEYDHLIFGYEEEAKSEQTNSFSSVLQKVNEDENILLIIGPEGGFSKEEVVLLKENGAIPVRLGRRILRTETASLYALASISYHFEELRC